MLRPEHFPSFKLTKINLLAASAFQKAHIFYPSYYTWRNKAGLYKPSVNPDCDQISCVLFR